MAREPVFFSFHYGNDVFRTQQVRNMGTIEQNTPVSANEWEQVKSGGDAAIRRWIDDHMSHRRCVIILIGSETAYREWVSYEIRKAWEDGRGLFGIYIHNLNCPRNGTCGKGPNPFNAWNVGNASMATLVQTHDPPADDAYGTISRNLESWVAAAIIQAKSR